MKGCAEGLRGGRPWRPGRPGRACERGGGWYVGVKGGNVGSSIGGPVEGRRGKSVLGCPGSGSSLEVGGGCCLAGEVCKTWTGC